VSFLDPRLRKKELVLGLVHEDVSRAYPYLRLGDRAVINDDVGGRPVLVVYDREAQMAVAFDRHIADGLLSFEATSTPGFPFFLRDRQTGSIWGLATAGLLHPLLGAVAMVVSSLIVVVHSQRLTRYPLPREASS
jgi:hypothetical protein